MSSSTPISLGAPIGVVGAGAMGRGIAQVAAAAGLRVLLTDVSSGAAEAARDFAGRMLGRAAEKGRTTREEAEAAMARIEPVPDLARLESCAVVIEAIVEDLEAKRELFRELERVVAADCILASNTSSLSITAIAASCERPQRVAGAHFFNPVPLMKLVEVVPGERTERAVVDALVKLVETFGHRAVRVRDVPLFLVNHVGRGYSVEALALLDEGVATATDIDNVMREAAGFPMGPFELFDLTALDVSHRAMESSFTQFYGEPRMRPSPETRRRFEAGLLGRKVGEGFYRYAEGRRVSDADSGGAGLPIRLPHRVWISRDDPACADLVVRALEGLADRIELEQGVQPSADALCLVTPMGEDTTTSATRQSLDPARTLAVDTLLELDKRVTLMATPLTAPARRDEGAALFAATGARVTTIADSSGFIAQRILAAVVNISCAVAQARIGTPRDIDDAVRIGRGYPLGPLTWGDRLGPRRVLRILETMHATTGEARYRPSPWLRRRALLGLSLKAPDLAVG